MSKSETLITAEVCWIDPTFAVCDLEDVLVGVRRQYRQLDSVSHRYLNVFVTLLAILEGSK